jgi:hypothetical protein
VSAAPLGAPAVWRSIVVATQRFVRVPPAAEIVARELVRQVGSAVDRGLWPSARMQ